MRTSGSTCSQRRMAAREERLRNKGHGGHKTLYGYFTATFDTFTFETAASKSDDTCAADRASSVDTNADRTSGVSDSNESSDSCIVEPGRKRMRKAITSHHHKPGGILQAWTREYQWLQKVCVGNEIGMICKLCQKHAILPQSGSKIWTNEPCMHLRLDKVKQHARSKMHGIALVAKADTTTQIGQALSDTLVLN